jgi:hypothetical protein
VKALATLILASVVVFSACDGEPACDLCGFPLNPVVTIAPASMNLSIGETKTFLASVVNDTIGAMSGVKWTSTHPAVATVDSISGAVTAVSAGGATIIASSRFRPGSAAAAQVTVRPDSSVPAAIVMPTLGEGAVPERYTAEVAVRGDFAYTTTWYFRGTSIGTTPGNVVKIWNISGNVPVLVDSLKLTAAVTTSDVQISPDGTLLVVSTEGSGGGSIAIYDRTDPAHPTLISRYQTQLTSRGVHTVKLSVIDGRLYGFLQIDPTPAELVIVDMSDPAHVQQVFAQPMGIPFVHDVFVRDGLLFAALWNDGMTIFDVGGGNLGGSPSNPVQIGNVKTKSGSIHNVWWLHDPVTGSKKYAFLGEEGASGGPVGPGGTSSGDIHVIDVSNMAAPKEVAIYTLGANAGTHNFWGDEQSGILYAAYYNGGVRAIDVRGDLSTCTSAQITVSAGTPATGLCDLRLMGREAGTALTNGEYYVWGVMMQGNRLYASDMSRGLVVLDITGLKR